MAKRKITRRTVSDQTARVSALLGGTPGRKLLSKPMPLEQELKAQAKLRRERWLERSKLEKAILAPLHKMIAADKGAMRALKSLQQLKRESGPKGIKLYSRPIRSHIRSGSIGTYRIWPFDNDWSAGNDSIANKNDGSCDIWTNASYGGAWAAAGLACWFRPVADNTYVRVGPWASGVCSWDDNSSGYVAHNYAFIGILIDSYDLNGNNMRVELDRRIDLWNDGTSWLEEHGNNTQFPVYFPQDTFFMADTSRWYRIWAWAFNSCDADGGFWGNSTANAKLIFPFDYFYFEQFT